MPLYTQPGHGDSVKYFHKARGKYYDKRGTDQSLTDMSDAVTHSLLSRSQRGLCQQQSTHQFLCLLIPADIHQQ
ncbi:hypothetical protein GBAR_LOCUS1239 [Geodia barretti]|uniref:Uncharacterized protein n=1 Tax=Geodia barretti TaxID=519541 RepID=A0AA35QV17_GEOBA|nr:hypothetical protein GBAR_LOCUS1239 [Geodia barretti]